MVKWQFGHFLKIPDCFFRKCFEVDMCQSETCIRRRHDFRIFLVLIEHIFENVDRSFHFASVQYIQISK